MSSEVNPLEIMDHFIRNLISNVKIFFEANSDFLVRNMLTVCSENKNLGLTSEIGVVILAAVQNFSLQSRDSDEKKLLIKPPTRKTEVLHSENQGEKKCVHSSCFCSCLFFVLPI